MSDLWSRLRAAEARAAEAPSPPAEPEPSSPEPAPPGWDWVTPLVAERRLTFDLERRFWAGFGGRLNPKDWAGVACFDTETTGLSGGAGTVAFLVGWARLVSAPGQEELPQVEVRQWFLRDLPGEPDLVEAVDRALGEVLGLVSFNGAPFDLPLLRTRWSLAGRVFPEKPHRDDLPPARRVWKRLLDSCRLSRLEQAVLGIHRPDDVAGALVPALWFDYLRRGAAPDFGAPLEGVLRHHAQDVYSLLCLDLLLKDLEAGPHQSRWEPWFDPFPDRRGLARLAEGGLVHPDPGPRTKVDFWGWSALAKPEAAEQKLEEAWTDRGSEALGLAWADRLKRRGDRRAVEIWSRLWTQTSSWRALEEWVKWLEHRDRDPAALAEALALVETALGAPFVPRALRESWEHRRDRLVRRLATSPGAGPGPQE